MEEALATRQDLLDLEKRLQATFTTKQELGETETRLKEDIIAATSEAIHDAETRLLRAIYAA